MHRHLFGPYGYRILGISMAVAVGSMAFSPVASGQGHPVAVAHPDSTRAPLLTKATAEERFEATVRLYLFQVRQAIQRGDTTALAGLIPDSVIPIAEKTVSARAGCGSLGQALTRLKTKLAAGARGRLPVGVIQLERETMIRRADGDTVAQIAVRLTNRSDRRVVRYAPLDFTFVMSGNGLGLAFVRGGLVGLCGLALSR